MYIFPAWNWLAFTFGVYSLHQLIYNCFHFFFLYLPITAFFRNNYMEETAIVLPKCLLQLLSAIMWNYGSSHPWTVFLSLFQFFCFLCFEHCAEEHLNHFCEMNFHLPKYEEYTFRDPKLVYNKLYTNSVWKIVAVCPDTDEMMKSSLSAFLGLACSPWDVIPFLERCALRVLCSVEGEPDRLSMENRSHISFVTFLPP